MQLLHYSLLRVKAFRLLQVFDLVAMLLWAWLSTAARPIVTSPPNQKLLVCQQCPFDLAAQPVAHHNAFDAINLSSSLEKDDSGNTIYFPLAGNGVVFICVDAGKRDTSLILFAHRFKFWVLYLARAATLG